MPHPYTTARLSRLLVPLAALALVGGSVATAHAAQPQAPAEHQPAGRVSSTEGPIVSVDFLGGTVADYVDALRGAAAGPDTAAVNVAVSKRAATVELPPVQLRSVTLHTALRAATYAAELPDGAELKVDAMPYWDNGAGPAVAAFALTVSEPRSPQTGGHAAQPSPTDSILRVMSLRDLVATGPESSGLPLESVLTAVQAALDLARVEGTPAPSMKFHEESFLLIVRGRPEQVQAVEQVVAELTKSVQRYRALDLDLQRKQLTLELELERAEGRMSLAKIKHDAARERERQLQELAEQGRVSNLELQEAQTARSEAYIAERTAEGEYRYAQKQLELLRREEWMLRSPFPEKKQPDKDPGDR